MKQTANQEETFSLPLALLDTVPVILFSITLILLMRAVPHPFIIIGGCCCILGGLGKVIWKLMIVLAHKDIPLLGAGLRYLMPLGFLLIVIGFFLAERSSVILFWKQMASVPSLIFLILVCVGALLMLIFSKKFERLDVRGNWLEEITNVFLQTMVLLVVLFAGH